MVILQRENAEFDVLVAVITSNGGYGKPPYRSLFSRTQQIRKLRVLCALRDEIIVNLCKP